MWFVALSLLIYTVLVRADITLNTPLAPWKAGTTVQIGWNRSPLDNGGVKTVDLDLMSGPGSNLVVARKIARGVDVIQLSSITFQVPGDLSPDDVYSVRATSGDSFVQYSGRFKIIGGVPGSASSEDSDTNANSDNSPSAGNGDSFGKKDNHSNAAFSSFELIKYLHLELLAVWLANIFLA